MSIKPLLAPTKNMYPSEDFLKKSSKFITTLIQKNNWVFSVEDMQLADPEISSEEGLLPLIFWVSGQNLAEAGFGHQELGFRVNSEALCGVTPELDAPIAPEEVWLHALHHELERVATAPDISAAINDWFNRWNGALSEKSLRLFPPKQQAPTAQQTTSS